MNDAVAGVLSQTVSKQAPALLYLASASPRRQQLLMQMGVPFALLLPGADEDAEALEVALPGEAPQSYVKRVTALKLDAALLRIAARQLPPLPVLAADTTVALGRRIFGKPLDAQDAAATLAALSGQTHSVLTAVSVAVPLAFAINFLATNQQPKSAMLLCRTRVSFAQLSAAQISAYIATGEPFGKAGAYAIQGAGGAFITHVSGSTSGVIGLPLFETRNLLREYGILRS